MPDRNWDGSIHAACVPSGEKPATGEGGGITNDGERGAGHRKDGDGDGDDAEDGTLWWDVLQGQPALIDDAALKAALQAAEAMTKFALYNSENKETWRKSILVKMQPGQDASTHKAQLVAEDGTYLGIFTVAEILEGWGHHWKLPSAAERSAAAERPLIPSNLWRLQPPGVCAS